MPLYKTPLNADSLPFIIHSAAGAAPRGSPFLFVAETEWSSVLRLLSSIRYYVLFNLPPHPPKSSEMEIIGEVNFPGLGSRPLCRIKFLLWTLIWSGPRVSLK